MKLKTEFIIEDSQKSRQKWMEEGSRRVGGDQLLHSISNYFELTNEQWIPLTNTHAVSAARKYIDFISATVFPPDGSWLSHTGKPSKQKQELLEYVKGTLSNSNFYPEMLRLIKEGVLYNRGLISTEYDLGLNFKCITDNNLCMVNASSPSNRRAYAIDYIGLEDLLTRYKGDIIDELQMDINRQGLVTPDMLARQYQIVHAIVPLTKFFFDDLKAPRGAKFKKVTLLMGAEKEGEIMHVNDTEKNTLYSAFPMMMYLPHYNTPLAAEAVVPASKCNEYETLIAQNARKVNNPSMAIGTDAFNKSSFNFDEGGLVVLQNNERKPEPVESKQSFNITGDEVVRFEMKIDKIFKIDLIERVAVINVSQFEAAMNELNALRAIAPAAVDLVTRVPQTLLKRAHMLLKQYDRDYARLAAAVDGELTMVGLTSRMRKLEIAANMGRFAQGIVPFLQVDQTAVQKIDGDVAVDVLADAYGLSDIVVTDDQVAAERQAQAQQQQQQMQQEQQLAQAETQEKLANAQKTE